VNLLTPDGNTVRELAAFRNTSIYPVVWSPDGARLAFAALTDATDPVAGQDILIIGSDGRELHEVYHSPMSSIAGLAFSPDGNYLLFQDDDALGRHIFVVDLSTLEQHKLQVSNLPMDSWWFAPSWRR
jgi:dipeptidyl aminopeptidase/acylaminoacyl peptidase